MKKLFLILTLLFFSSSSLALFDSTKILLLEDQNTSCDNNCSPAGNNKEVQFNEDGNFGASSNFYYDYDNNTLYNEGAIWALGGDGMYVKASDGLSYTSIRQTGVGTFINATSGGITLNPASEEQVLINSGYGLYPNTDMNLGSTNQFWKKIAGQTFYFVDSDESNYFSFVAGDQTTDTAYTLPTQ